MKAIYLVFAALLLVFFVSLFGVDCKEEKKKEKKNADKKDKRDNKDKKDKKEKKVKSNKNDNKAQKDKKKDKKGSDKAKVPKGFPAEPSNVIEVIKNNTHIIKGDPNGRYLILFYDSYGKKSRKMNSLLNKISLSSDKGIEGLKFIRINSFKQRDISNELGGYLDNPALHLICNDIDGSFTYDGPLEVEHIINFIKKIIKVKIQEVKSNEDFQKIKHKGSNILFVGDPVKYKNVFNTIAKYAKKFFKNAYWTNDDFFFNKFGIEKKEMDAIAYFTINGTLNEGERMNFTPDEMNKETILKISEIYSRKPFSYANLHKLEKIIEFNLRTLFVVHKEGDETTEQKKQLDDNLRQLAMKYREDYWFLKVNSGDQISDILIETLNLDMHHEFPTIGIIDNVKSSGIDLDSYAFPHNVNKTYENIEKFILDHKAGLLQRELITEVEHDEVEHEEMDSLVSDELKKNGQFHLKNKTNASGIQTVVAKSVNKLVFNNHGKDVVLFICSDTKHCNEYITRFSRVSNKLQKNEGIFFGKINHILNEIPGVNFTHVPALIIVPDVSKNTEKKYYSFSEKNFTSSEVLKFVQKWALNPLNNIIQNTKYDEKDSKEERSVKTKYILRKKDEAKMDDIHGFASGNGFTRAVQRYAHDYYQNKEGIESEERRHDDHDSEDYDNDPEQGYYEKEDL